MLHKVMSIIRKMLTLAMIGEGKVTIGHLSRITGIPYSTIRKRLKTALNSELVDCETLPYKSTGKKVYWVTAKGIDWLDGYRGLGI